MGYITLFSFTITWWGLHSTTFIVGFFIISIFFLSWGTNCFDALFLFFCKKKVKSLWSLLMVSNACIYKGRKKLYLEFKATLKYPLFYSLTKSVRYWGMVWLPWKAVLIQLLLSFADWSTECMTGSVLNFSIKVLYWSTLCVSIR